jgi:hypothetical protein
MDGTQQTIPNVVDTPSKLRPLAVPIATAQILLGEVCRATVYNMVGRGELDALKDRGRTLITTASIERRMLSLPEAKIGPRKTKSVATANQSASNQQAKRE